MMRPERGLPTQVTGDALAEVVARHAPHWTREATDIAAYLAREVADPSHREVVGPLVPASGGSGVVLVDGREAASWGDPGVPEMAFSVTKTVVSVVAGVAFDVGLLQPYRPVVETVDLPELDGPLDPRVTWAHLLQQTSQWEGTLWGKPTSADVQSVREGTEVHGTPPGEGWAYNDVRMNLLTYALTVLWRRSLEDVLREAVMAPLGVTGPWAWHGYRTSTTDLDGQRVPVVSGGAHWGGGLVIGARDLARLGQLYLAGGVHEGRRVVSRQWIERSWRPCPVKPEYGYLWWLNDGQVPWPGAPTTGRSARGNGGRHLLWVDPARRLVLASHWTESPADLIRDVSAAVPAVSGWRAGRTR